MRIRTFQSRVVEFGDKITSKLNSVIKYVGNLIYRFPPVKFKEWRLGNTQPQKWISRFVFEMVKSTSVVKIYCSYFRNINHGVTSFWLIANMSDWCFDNLSVYLFICLSRISILLRGRYRRRRRRRRRKQGEEKEIGEGRVVLIPVRRVSA